MIFSHFSSSKSYPKDQFYQFFNPGIFFTLFVAYQGGHCGYNKEQHILNSKPKGIYFSLFIYSHIAVLM